MRAARTNLSSCRSDWSGHAHLGSAFQVDHKHPERRILVAEACAELAGLVPPQMASSLLLSMLQQLCSDSDATVRASVAFNLAHLLPHLEDHDKYSMVSMMS